MRFSKRGTKDTARLTPEVYRTYFIRVNWNEGCAGWAAEVWKPHWIINFPAILVAGHGPFKTKEEANIWAQGQAEEHLSRREEDQVYSYKYVAGEKGKNDAPND